MGMSEERIVEIQLYLKNQEFSPYPMMSADRMVDECLNEINRLRSELADERYLRSHLIQEKALLRHMCDELKIDSKDKTK